GRDRAGRVGGWDVPRLPPGLHHPSLDAATKGDDGLGALDRMDGEVTREEAGRQDIGARRVARVAEVGTERARFEIEAHPGEDGVPRERRIRSVPGAR